MVILQTILRTFAEILKISLFCMFYGEQNKKCSQYTNITNESNSKN